MMACATVVVVRFRRDAKSVIATLTIFDCCRVARVGLIAGDISIIIFVCACAGSTVIAAAAAATAAAAPVAATTRCSGDFVLARQCVAGAASVILR
jgi:hypothetical protein